MKKLLSISAVVAAVLLTSNPVSDISKGIFVGVLGNIIGDNTSSEYQFAMAYREAKFDKASNLNNYFDNGVN